MNKQAIISVTIPFIFCIVITQLALLKNGETAFLSFLPMCFLFMAFPILNLLKKISVLEKSVEELKKK